MIGLFLVVSAIQATPAVPASGASPVAAAEKVRCRRVEETGSNIRGKRVCHTDAEWRALHRSNNMDLDRMRDRAPINSQRPTGG
jgi:hypothetical protein